MLLANEVGGTTLCQAQKGLRRGRQITRIGRLKACADARHCIFQPGIDASRCFCAFVFALWMRRGMLGYIRHFAIGDKAQPKGCLWDSASKAEKFWHPCWPSCSSSREEDAGGEFENGVLLERRWEGRCWAATRRLLRTAHVSDGQSAAEQQRYLCQCSWGVLAMALTRCDIPVNFIIQKGTSLRPRAHTHRHSTPSLTGRAHNSSKRTTHRRKKSPSPPNRLLGLH